MKIKIISGFVCSSLFSAALYATVPPDLIFKNKPIDALCFNISEGNPSTIDLNNCGLTKEKYILKGSDKSLIQKGYIGYNWQDPEFQGATQGYSYYKIFNAGNHQYWLFTVNNGGGSGSFTSIYWVKRKNAETLEIKALSGGDRCDGGLQDVSEVNNTLTYSVNLTAYDFITLSPKYAPKLQAYDNLAACAVCCVAKAFYEVSTNTPPQLKYVDLGKNKNPEEMPDQGTYQSCFNQLFSSYVSLGETQLKQNKLDEFAIKFNQRCMKK